MERGCYLLLAPPPEEPREDEPRDEDPEPLDELPRDELPRDELPLDLPDDDPTRALPEEPEEPPERPEEGRATELPDDGRE